MEDLTVEKFKNLRMIRAEMSLRENTEGESSLSGRIIPFTGLVPITRCPETRKTRPTSGGYRIPQKTRS